MIIELKKGGFEIKRDEMDQAMGYVDAIEHTNRLASKPVITAYVVGDRISNQISPDRTVGTNSIHACTYMQLVATAKRRLFKLKETLNERYEQMPIDSIIEKVLKEPKQLEITKNNLEKA